MRKDLEKVESLLLERKIELEQKLEILKHEESSDGQVHDTGDDTLFSMAETLKASLQNNEYEEYKMILKALEQIAKGEYGTCVDCNELISSKRLTLYPNASRCVMCQEMYEENKSLHKEDF